MAKDQGATATAPKPNQDTPQEPSEEEKFRDEQRALASSQNLDGDDAVPEKRPIASQTIITADDDLTQRLTKAGAIGQDKRMEKEAYDRAASKSQAKKAADNSVFEAIKVADMVEVTKGPHKGRFMAVTRIESHQDASELAIKNAGVPEARFIQPKTVEGRARGDSRDGEILILDVEEAGLRKVDWMGTGRG